MNIGKNPKGIIFPYYKLTSGDTADNTTADGKQLFVELGQSNMEGQDGDLSNPDYPFPVTNGYEWDGTDLIALTTLRGDANRGSPANYFAERYKIINSGKKPVMSESARSGSGLGADSGTSHNWGPTAELRGLAETKTADALTELGLISPRAALWCQGERDAQQIDDVVSYTKDDAKTAMIAVIDWWFGLYPNCPFLISVTGDTQAGDNTQGWQDLRDVQRQMADLYDLVYIAFDGAKDFPGEGKMYNHLHYNYEGLKDMGEAFADQVILT